MQRIMILFMIFICCIRGFSQECQDTSYLISFQEIKWQAFASNTLNILSYSDSLLSQLDAAGLNDCELYFYIKFYRGQGLELNSQFEEAIALYHEIIRICKEKSYLKVAAECYLSLARVYETFSRPQDCLRNLNLALEIIDEYNYEDIASRHAARYASYQRIYNDKNIARDYAYKAIRLGETHQVPRSIVDGYLIAGLVAETKDSALYYLKKAENQFNINNAYEAAASMAGNQARIYLENEKFPEAKETMDHAIAYLEKSLNRGTFYHIGLSRIYRFKEKIANAEGKIDSAYAHSLKAYEYEKLVDMEVDQQQINDMEIQFALEQERSRTQNARLITNILIIGFVIFFLLSGILALYYFRLRFRNKLISKQSGIIISSNDKLRASNKEKELLLSEVHHRVKNNLHLIISLLTMYARNIQNNGSKEHFETVSEKVMSISLIHEQLYRKEDFEQIDIRDYFEELKSKYQNLHSNENIEIHIHCDDICFNIDTVLPIGIITTELLNNSIKYAKKNKNYLQLYIELKRQGTKNIFSFKDNGPGYPNGQLISKGKTIGGFLVNSMVRQLLANGRSYNDNGAVFEMIFVEKLTSPV